jgi:hypothetical protein
VRILRINGEEERLTDDEDDIFDCLPRMCEAQRIADAGWNQEKLYKKIRDENRPDNADYSDLKYQRDISVPSWEIEE